MTQRLPRWSLLPVLALGACTIPNTIEQLDDSSPPAEFGRPAWVRTTAGVGGWLGGIVGGVASIVLLPVTWPLSELCDEALTDHAQDQFLLFPATGLAAGGHALFGFPADFLDFTFRRIWVDGPQPVYEFDYVPLDAPEIPRPAASGAEASDG
ncbi:MAG: hypothetical protein KAI24_19185 [Planctomycetes bacterium]|nr:hypothetical protein [Planctomycetota bacterium]